MVHVWSWVVSVNVDEDGGDGRHCPRANLAASASLGRVWSLGLVWQLLGACEYRHHQHHVFTIVFIILIYSYLTQVRSLPFLVSKSLCHSVLVLRLELLDLSSLLHGFSLSCSMDFFKSDIYKYMDFTKLLHGYVKFDVWIFPGYYMDLSKLIHGFVWVVTWICQSCYMDFSKFFT